MIKLSREMLTEALERVGVYADDEDDSSIREAYSGRGMRGTTCLAVDLRAGMLPVFLVALTLALAEEGRGEDAIAIGEHTETDSMGLGEVAYWRNVELTD